MHVSTIDYRVYSIIYGVDKDMHIKVAVSLSVVVSRYKSCRDTEVAVGDVNLAVGGADDRSRSGRRQSRCGRCRFRCGRCR